MEKGVHVTKRSDGWVVERAGASRAASVHRTQAEAEAAAKRLALKSGGAEVVLHRADGRIRDKDTVGAAQIDELKKRRGAAGRKAPGTSKSGPTRAARSEGPRTTLRLPTSLAAIADQLAEDLGISRNDALLRLATRGARLYTQEQAIAERRQERWAAVVPGVVDIDQARFPTAEEASEAILAGREALSGLT